jgi:hypothetical protein
MSVKRALVAVALTGGLLVLSVPSALASRTFRVDIETALTLGALGFQSLPVGTDDIASQLSGYEHGMNIIFGISGNPEAPAQTKVNVKAKCVLGSDARFDAAPPRAGDIAAGSYGAIAGVAIPNSDACPGDPLVLFVRTPFLLPPQFLPACLSNLPAVVFNSVDPLELSDELAEGDEETLPIFSVPFILAYPVAYFVALVPSGAPITTPPLQIAANVCAPTIDGAGRLLIPCFPI